MTYNEAVVPEGHSRRWLQRSVEGVAPMLTLDQAHELLEALGHRGRGRLVIAGDDEEAPRPGVRADSRHAAGLTSRAGAPPPTAARGP